LAQIFNGKEESLGDIAECAAETPASTPLGGKPLCNQHDIKEPERLRGHHYS
jgi:hypothetical protein